MQNPFRKILLIEILLFTVDANIINCYFIMLSKMTAKPVIALNYQGANHQVLARPVFPTT